MDVSQLNDNAAVEALCVVVKKWSSKRDFEVLIAATNIRKVSTAALGQAPLWAVGKPEGNPESGAFSRKILAVLLDAEDDEVISWTEAAVQDALAKQKQVTAQMLDPISLAIFGVIVIGGILAARVKKIGHIEFYDGIPKGLGDILKEVVAVK